MQVYWSGKVRGKAQVPRQHFQGQKSASPLEWDGWWLHGVWEPHFYGASEGPDPTFPQLSAQVTDTYSIRGTAQTQNKS